MNVHIPLLCSPEDVVKAVQEIGFLPFFKHEIAGYSLEEHCPPDLWFSQDQDGPWEWKGPIIRTGTCVYGKFFGGRAGYISLEWLADFANLRRDGYDFEGWYEDGHARRQDKLIYDCIDAGGAMLSKDVKRRCDFRKGGNKGFDSAITRLQMQTFVTIADFVYLQDQKGNPYGWGVAVYDTPEHLHGESILDCGGRTPAESRERILAHLRALSPSVDEKAWKKLLK